MTALETSKRQKRTVGAVVKIPLEEGYHTYARILKNAFAFYDLRTKEDIEDLEKITASKVLFITGVYDYAITKGYWLKVGTIPLGKEFEQVAPQYIQDAIQKDKFKLFYSNGKVKDVSLEEVRGLERVAVWTPEAIQERLNDHYAGRKNYSVESMLHPELSHEEIKKRIAVKL